MVLSRSRPDSPIRPLPKQFALSRDACGTIRQVFHCSNSSTIGRTPATRAMVIISPAVVDDDPLAAANGASTPRPAPAANNLDPAAALSLFDDVVHGTTTATEDVGAGTTPWWGWSSPPPYYAGSDAYASSSFPPPPPPPLQSHGEDLACYAGTVMDTSFLQLQAAPPVYTQPELSYLYYPQEPQQGFPSCFPAPFAVEPTTIRPELQVPATTQPASMSPASLYYYPQTQATTTGSASVQEASPALAGTQRAQDDGTRPAPRRRGRPSKRALAASEPTPVSKPNKRVAVGINRAASSTSQRTSSAVTGSATMSSAAGQVPDQAGGSSSSTGSTSVQGTAACTGTDSPMAATGPRYADTSAVGVRFRPTDQELIVYLRMKYGRQQMPVKFFKDFDVYQAHPMEIKGAYGESQNGCWYAFSRRDRKYMNGKRPARSVFVEGAGGDRKQVGFWKPNSRLGDVHEGGKKDGAVIGRMTSLTFQLGRQPRGKQTGWKMREYTIPENQHQPDGSAKLLNDWVVCQLFYKERSGCTNAESKSDENATSVGQERPRRGKSEKDRSAISVGQKRPRRNRKSKKDKNANPHVAVGQEDGPGEAAGESVEGGDMQPQMVPASGCSEQDLCVEDYLCDVAFAQQNDAANYTYGQA